jgi:cytochrome P450
MKTSTDEDAL